MRSPSGFGRGGAGFSGFSGRPGFSHFHHFGGPRFFPFYGAAFGFGLASFYDPWFYGFYDGPYPYYGYYAPYPPPAGYYYPPGAAAPPPGAPPIAAPPSASQPPPAACGSWSWDAAKQIYNWVPCGAPAAPAA